MSFMDGRAFIMALEGGVRFTQAKLRDSRLRKQTEVASCKADMADNADQFCCQFCDFCLSFSGAPVLTISRSPLRSLTAVQKCRLPPSPPCPHHTLGR